MRRLPQFTAEQSLGQALSSYGTGQNYTLSKMDYDNNDFRATILQQALSDVKPADLGECVTRGTVAAVACAVALRMHGQLSNVCRNQMMQGGAACARVADAYYR